MKPVRFLTTLTVLSSLAVPAAASAGTTDFPLRGWWPLNEGRGQTVYDWSGKGNHGFLGSTRQADANDPSWTKGRFFGSALSFSGDDFVTVPDSTALEPQELTVSLWFKANGSPGTFRYLLAKGADSCRASSYSLQTSWHGGLQFVLWNGSQQFASGYAGPAVYDGRWHHAAGTWNGVAPKLYVDGRLMPGGNVSSEIIEYEGPAGGTSIGGYHGSCDLLFAGDIDEVHVWGKALPVDQVWNRWGWLLGIPGRT